MNIQTIDDYIEQASEDVRDILQELRRIVREEAPVASEAIKYQMPTFVLNGNLVHFAAFKHHIGFYPVPSGVAAFQQELAAYKQGKGSVQFPLDQPMPYDLIRRIVQYRVAENLEKAQVKKIRKRMNLIRFNRTGRPAVVSAGLPVCCLSARFGMSPVDFGMSPENGGQD